MSAERSGASRKTPADDDETMAESVTKRKRIRKGTRSCWECKRRKMKCIFDSSTDAICIRCQRRSTKCVSQEFPEEISQPVDNNRKMGDRIVRVENLIEQLIQKVANDGPGPYAGNPDRGIPMPASIDSDSSRILALYKPSQDNDTVETEIHHDLPKSDRLPVATETTAGPGGYEALSRSLHQSLPSPEDTQRTCKASRHFSVLFNEMLTMPYSALQDRLDSPEILLEPPGPNVHPVLIARHMLLLATFLQPLHPDLHPEIRGLSTSPRAMMKKLADTAISLVTTNDELLGSIEGLECVMMESLYQANVGNLRRSWIAVRRAMLIAQLMGLHRVDSEGRAQYKVLDPKTRAQPQFMWFRIVFYDRHLCLLLGLPQGSNDLSMAADAVLANDTPMGRLERTHCVIAARILERNESNPSRRDFGLTQILDGELQRAARCLSSKWWLTPNLGSDVNDSQTLFWGMRRLINQLLHYDLLNQLHLPYMLRSSAERRFEYSRMTCVNASREVLSRFIVLRSFNRSAFSCRTVDFLALMAAMTLLLAHLDSHRRSQADNLLAHQYLSDRAMIEQTQENMKEVMRLNADSLSAQSADLLSRLLAIDAKAAEGNMHSAMSVSVQRPDIGTTQPDQGDDTGGIMRVHIPYFGIIKIAHEGVISKETPNARSDVSNRNPAIFAGSSSATTAPTLQTDAAMSSAYATGSGMTLGADEAGNDGMREFPSWPRAASGPRTGPQVPHEEPSVPFTSSDEEISTQFAPQPSAVADELLQQYPYPGPTDGADDWALQGVDMAFFDSLMRGAGNAGNGDAVWPTWETGL
ncbi:hypothetical protein A1O1_03543 [Capronia coronata CBS 617.96]|uniref:Zn(2)-C6 fungal-type domain-containing protein n=1 Tax=Capronia coronata CBS 617.96 TaxID=1182541 RepID=W9YMJ1_9EURO|nr:uncharacterized protein A1O1_03543 [Capronia coronata CBS 617.96]EXJ90441.1 hypothetical protein A1O1_03543 [Capronia coronata CBS 617.96]